jgi:adenylate kinase
MGATGSGKSLQSRLLADECGYTWISTGKILRSLMTSKSRQEMLAGELVSDQELIQMLSQKFESIKPKQLVVLDGFPRTLAQAEWLIEWAKSSDFEITAIFNLEVAHAVVRNRLIKRGRFDDTETAIKQRFKEFELVTQPIIKLLKDEGYRIFNINAEGNPETIHQDIIKAINGISINN